MTASVDRGAAQHVEYPAWLRPLVAAAPTMTVAPVLRPPAGDAGRASAVLVLFGRGVAGPDLLLIERSATLREHPGQPAFPGGGIEPSDGDPHGAGRVAAALREAEEETGLDPSGVDVLAVLPDLYVRHSGYRVAPVLGWWRRPCAVQPVDPAEVAAVARVPVAELADPANRLLLRYRGGMLSPAFRAGGLLIWGFTAAVVDRLLVMGGWERPWPHDRVEDLA